MSQNVLHLLVLHFPPLIVTTSPGGGDIGLLKDVVASAVSSFPGRDTVDDEAAGDDMVAAVGGSLKTPAVAALLIVPC